MFNKKEINKEEFEQVVLNNIKLCVNILEYVNTGIDITEHDLNTIHNAHSILNNLNKDFMV